MHQGAIVVLTWSRFRRALRDLLNEISTRWHYSSSKIYVFFPGKCVDLFFENYIIKIYAQRVLLWLDWTLPGSCCQGTHQQESTSGHGGCHLLLRSSFIGEWLPEGSVSKNNIWTKNVKYWKKTSLGTVSYNLIDVMLFHQYWSI